MQAPALIAREAASAYARVNGRSISAAAFCADILACAEALPDAEHVINLCLDRYQFSVGFFAALARGQTNLLPTQRDAGNIDTLRKQFRNVRVLCDSAQQHSDSANTLGADHELAQASGDNGTAESPTLEATATAAIAFTSGSTGTPRAHPKPWGLFDQGRVAHAQLLPGLPEALSGQASGLVATVPCWHMYGLEWALLLPTVAPLEVFCGNDFFPLDVSAALGEYHDNGATKVLISTPVHLKALLTTPVTTPVGVTVSATAPLDRALARNLEAHLGTRLLEVYGCSEVGSLASRPTAQQSGWDFFDAFHYSLNNQTMTVTTPWLPEPITLGDGFAPASDHRFELLGRASDIIKVAGKRASLAHLNHIAQSIPGVEDAVFYQPEQLGLADTGRLGLLLVAPGLALADVKRELAKHLDRAFMPRPIYQVEALPREASSKLPQTAIATLVSRLRSVGAQTS